MADGTKDPEHQDAALRSDEPDLPDSDLPTSDPSGGAPIGAGEQTAMGEPANQRHLRSVPPAPAGRRQRLSALERDEDEDLVELARNGDAPAFSKLFERHHGRVYAMCCRMLKEPAEVEDAVQHTFLEAWRCLDKFEGRSRFSTWITRIAIHTCLGFRRKVKRLVFTDEIPEPKIVSPNLSAGPLAPDEGASRAQRQRAVDEVLAELSEKKRAVFVLAELEGLTAPEISRAISIPEATVRTRLFHARRDFAAKARAHPGFADLFAGRGAIRGES